MDDKQQENSRLEEELSSGKSSFDKDDSTGSHEFVRHSTMYRKEDEHFCQSYQKLDTNDEIDVHTKSYCNDEEKYNHCKSISDVGINRKIVPLNKNVCISVRQHIEDNNVCGVFDAKKDDCSIGLFDDKQMLNPRNTADDTTCIVTSSSAPNSTEKCCPSHSPFKHLYGILCKEKKENFSQEQISLEEFVAAIKKIKDYCNAKKDLERMGHEQKKTFRYKLDKLNRQICSLPKYATFPYGRVPIRLDHNDIPEISDNLITDDIFCGHEMQGKKEEKGPIGASDERDSNTFMAYSNHIELTESLQKLTANDILFGHLYPTLREIYPERSDAAIYEMCKNAIIEASRQGRNDVIDALKKRMQEAQFKNARHSMVIMNKNGKES